MSANVICNPLPSTLSKGSSWLYRHRFERPYTRPKSQGRKTIPNQGSRSQIIKQTCRGSLSVVSNPIFANRIVWFSMLTVFALDPLKFSTTYPISPIISLKRTFFCFGELEISSRFRSCPSRRSYTASCICCQRASYCPAGCPVCCAANCFHSVYCASQVRHVQTSTTSVVTFVIFSFFPVSSYHVCIFLFFTLYSDFRHKIS